MHAHVHDIVLTTPPSVQALPPPSLLPRRYLHEKKSIAHLDLKPENILLRSTDRDDISLGIFSQRSGAQRVDVGAGDGNGDGSFAHPSFDPARSYAVRICDFGLAQRIVPLRSTTLVVDRGGNGGGTPFYMPPEAIIAAWGGTEERTAASATQGVHCRGRGSGSASASDLGSAATAPPIASLAASSSSPRDTHPGESMGGGTLSFTTPRSTRDAVLATAAATDDAPPLRSHGSSRPGGGPAEKRLLARQSSAMERSMSADVYAFGIIFWELVTCDELYPNARGLGFFLDSVAVAGERPPTPRRELCDEATAALMARCWATRLEERPHFSDIVQELHAIIRNTL